VEEKEGCVLFLNKRQVGMVLNKRQVGMVLNKRQVGMVLNKRQSRHGFKRTSKSAWF